MGMQFSEDEVDEMIREVDVDGQLPHLLFSWVENMLTETVNNNTLKCLLRILKTSSSPRLIWGDERGGRREKGRVGKIEYLLEQPKVGPLLRDILDEIGQITSLFLKAACFS